MDGPPVLEIADLGITLPGRVRGEHSRTIVRGVDLQVRAGESVALVGESGSGKSMTTRAVMGLLPRGARRTGDIRFEGEDVTGFGRRRLAEFRSREVAMIYQDPRAHTNPLRPIGDFLTEGVVTSGQMSFSEARVSACELLREVGIHDAERRMSQYPHELSGGLLQRVMIVAALLPGARLVLADEPTTALDVTVQSEVMAILEDQLRQRGVGMLLITHDLDLAAAVTDSVAVMYAGTIVESGAAEQVYGSPRHPYTSGLLRSRPSITAREPLIPIPGRPLAAFEVGAGCVFASRCAYAVSECLVTRPSLRVVDGRAVACHRAEVLRSELVVDRDPNGVAND